MHSVWRTRLRSLGVLAALLFIPRPQFAYSVQTHEQLIDLAWKPAIVPLLLARYPGLTASQLDEAHAYAYGGCAIQDLGYYPFGNQFFSNLTHYVRTGDFIRSLLRNAHNADEFAFAIGALSHYVGDTTGHSLAINPSVASDFPSLRAKYGRSVSYDENPHAHVRVEFAFDINELAHRRFAPSRYLAHVGIQVATDLLARAFDETYGLHLDNILGPHRQRPSFGSYKFAVRRFLPRIAYAETVLHRRRMPSDIDDREFQQFEQAFTQSDSENNWEQYRKHAGIGTYMLAGLIYILPPIGPLADLRIKGPDQPTEQAYVRSINVTTGRLRHLLADIAARDTPAIIRDLPNQDLDTGLPTAPGTYRLTDQTYAQLLHQITQPSFGTIPAGLVQDVENYYSNPAGPNSSKRNPKAWAQVLADLAVLPTLPTIPEP